MKKQKNPIVNSQNPNNPNEIDSNNPNGENHNNPDNKNHNINDFQSALNCVSNTNDINVIIQTLENSNNFEERNFIELYRIALENKYLPLNEIIQILTHASNFLRMKEFVELHRIALNNHLKLDEIIQILENVTIALQGSFTSFDKDLCLQKIYKIALNKNLNFDEIIQILTHARMALKTSDRVFFEIYKIALKNTLKNKNVKFNEFIQILIYARNFLKKEKLICLYQYALRKNISHNEKIQILTNTSEFLEGKDLIELYVYALSKNRNLIEYKKNVQKQNKQKNPIVHSQNPNNPNEIDSNDPNDIDHNDIHPLYYYTNLINSTNDFLSALKFVSSVNNINVIIQTLTHVANFLTRDNLIMLYRCTLNRDVNFNEIIHILTHAREICQTKSDLTDFLSRIYKIALFKIALSKNLQLDEFTLILNHAIISLKGYETIEVSKDLLKEVYNKYDIYNLDTLTDGSQKNTLINDCLTKIYRIIFINLRKNTPLPINKQFPIIIHILTHAQNFLTKQNMERLDRSASHNNAEYDSIMEILRKTNSKSLFKEDEFIHLFKYLVPEEACNLESGHKDDLNKNTELPVTISKIIQALEDDEIILKRSDTINLYNFLLIQ